MHIGIFCDAWATMELFHIVLCWQLFLSLATQQVSIRWFSTWARCLTLLVPDHEELFKEHEKSNKNKGTISYAGSDLTSEADKYSEWGSRVHYGSNSESIRMERNFFWWQLRPVRSKRKEAVCNCVSLSNIFFSYFLKSFRSSFWWHHCWLMRVESIPLALVYPPYLLVKLLKVMSFLPESIISS